MTEKSFYCTLSIYVSLIFLCLFCLAYSSASLFYKQVGYYDKDIIRAFAEVEITDKTENIVLTESKLGGYVIYPESEHSVKLSSDSDVDTMFCRISIIANNGNKVYYTSQFNKDNSLSKYSKAVAADEFNTMLEYAEGKVNELLDQFGNVFAQENSETFENLQLFRDLVK